jgi:16S rRNA (guanine966-N2)-methyltransferase
MQRTREAVFDSLRRLIPGSGFADLYAAAGSVGIEALSRGAAYVTFVERDPEALGYLEENLRLLGLDEPRARIYRGDVEAFVASGGLDEPSLRVVFADPPYDDDVHSLLALIDDNAYPHLECLVVEHRSQLRGAGLQRWTVTRSRRYGGTRVTFYRPSEGGES